MLARDLVYYMLAAVYLFVCFMLCNNRIVNEYSYALRHPHRVSLLRFVWMLLVYVQRTNPTIASTRFLLNSLLFAQFVVAFVYVICICNGIARRSHRSLSSLNPNGIGWNYMPFRVVFVYNAERVCLLLASLGFSFKN